MLGRLLPFAIAWLAGDSIGIRRRYVHELEEQAEQPTELSETLRVIDPG